MTVDATDQLYYDTDFCRVMAKVTLRLCNEGFGNNPDDQRAAVDMYTAALAALRADPSCPEPADLVEHTNRMVQAERQRWVDYRARFEQWLSLPDAVRSMSPGTVENAQAKIEFADRWIAAIDAEWPERT